MPLTQLSSAEDNRSRMINRFLSWRPAEQQLTQSGSAEDGRSNMVDRFPSWRPAEQQLTQSGSADDGWFQPLLQGLGDAI